MGNNITTFIEKVKAEKQLEYVSAYDLFHYVKDNEQLLNILCGAVCETYDNIERTKKILG